MDNRVIVVNESVISEIVNKAVTEALSKNVCISNPSSSPEKKYLKGYRELSEYLRCSITTLWKWKKFGIIPFSQKGSILIFDVEKIDEALRNNPPKRIKIK